FVGTLVPLAEKAARARSSYRASKALHRLLHERLFRRFSFDAPGMADLLDRGEVNCVTATLTEGIAARWLGVEAPVAAGPRHVFPRLPLDGRAGAVEPASRDGCDRSWLGARARGFLLAYRLATPEELAADPAAAIDAYRQVRGLVSLEEAPAFLRYNRAVTGIERGDGLE